MKKEHKLDCTDPSFLNKQKEQSKRKTDNNEDNYEQRR
jgi:hypothetical protein